MKNKLFLITLISVGFLLGSCSDFLDVNQDPNNPTEVPPSLVLPVGLNYTASYVNSDRSLSHLGSMMMFVFGESKGFNWYRSEFQYAVTTSFYSGMFDNAYTSALKQYHILTELPEAEYGYYNAIGLVMKSYTYQILVDLYGDIPYSEALQRGALARPKYDDAETIYKDLIVQLDKAIKLIDDASATTVAVGADDIVFAGDMAKWQQFANAVKIRVLARLSKMASNKTYIQTELTKIGASGIGYFTDNSVEINPGYYKDDGKQNPYWNSLGMDISDNQTLSYQATCATKFVVDVFTNTNDDRLDYIFETPATGHLGVDQGDPANALDDYAPDKVSNLNLDLGTGVLRGPTSGIVIMTRAELELNLAELAQRGFTGIGTAESHYNDGVTASFLYLGLTAGDATNYLAQAKQNVRFSSSADKYDAIFTQKWIATMGINSEQSWFDYNRTGYPKGQGLTGAANKFPVSQMRGSHADRPVRLMYPGSEVTRNKDNMPAQPDAFTKKIFWAN